MKKRFKVLLQKPVSERAMHIIGAFLFGFLIIFTVVVAQHF